MSSDLSELEQLDDFLQKLKTTYRSNDLADLLIDCNNFFTELDDDQKVACLNYLMGKLNKQSFL
jgi:hypothetical protein